MHLYILKLISYRKRVINPESPFIFISLRTDLFDFFAASTVVIRFRLKFQEVLASVRYKRIVGSECATIDLSSGGVRTRGLVVFSLDFLSTFCGLSYDKHQRDLVVAQMSWPSVSTES
jgi:hypothetical protein